MFGHHHRRGHDDRSERHGWGARGMRHRGEHGFGRGWGGPRGHHRGGGRPFEQGDLRLLVLDLIAQQPRHGYELIKAIEDAMDGAYSPSPGVVYPTLTLLEETGLVSGEAQGAKKLYTLTEEGRAYLDGATQQVAAAKSRMDEAKRRFGPKPSAEVGRAMENLMSAVMLRISLRPSPPRKCARSSTPWTPPPARWSAPEHAGLSDGEGAKQPLTGGRLYPGEVATWAEEEDRLLCTIPQGVLISGHGVRSRNSLLKGYSLHEIGARKAVR